MIEALLLVELLHTLLMVLVSALGLWALYQTPRPEERLTKDKQYSKNRDTE